MIANGVGREVTKVKQIGIANIKLQVTIRNLDKFGYKIN